MNTLFLLAAGLSDPAACALGEACAEATHWGAWGLIGMGVAFFVVGVLPARHGLAKGSGATRGGGLQLLRMLHVRIEKELTGWRRLQWPALGVLFVALGVATLAGWR